MGKGDLAAECAGADERVVVITPAAFTRMRTCPDRGSGRGTLLVIFELSGSGRPVGYADATEEFESSVLGNFFVRVNQIPLPRFTSSVLARCRNSRISGRRYSRNSAGPARCEP